MGFHFRPHLEKGAKPRWLYHNRLLGVMANKLKEGGGVGRRHGGRRRGGEQSQSQVSGVQPQEKKGRGSEFARALGLHSWLCLVRSERGRRGRRQGRLRSERPQGLSSKVRPSSPGRGGRVGDGSLGGGLLS